MEKETEFIKGKYYQATAEDFYLHEFIMRFSHLDDKYEYRVHYDYSTSVNKESNYYNCNILDWCHKEVLLKEISLEEVQQYLPEGHPDKIKKVTYEIY